MADNKNEPDTNESLNELKRKTLIAQNLFYERNNNTNSKCENNIKLKTEQSVIQKSTPNTQKRKIHMNRVPTSQDENIDKIRNKRFKEDKSEKTLEKIEQKVLTKPPLPPKPRKTVIKQQINNTNSARSKKINVDANAATVQKLTTCAEQLRLEISELKAALANEKCAVRALRAQQDAENRKFKVETKKRQEASLLQTKRKTTNIGKRKEYDEESTISETQQISDTAKLVQEIFHLKEVNKSLEDKIQISSQADRRKNSDIRELKDSYELRLTQISKSAKIEIHRLLEEIKAKEKHIVQLKKEVSLCKDCNNKNGNKAPPVQNMRKGKEIERSSCSTNNKINNSTTCGNELVSLPHDMHERMLEAHTDSTFCRNKDTSGSDNDSALSSAPPSLSPQPGTFPNSTDVWQAFVKESKELENLQKDYESLQEENQLLHCELSTAQIQVRELEKAMLSTNKNTEELLNRVTFLEHKEESLQKLSHELQEQNELLEFRIIELEESHDKWSLRSNPTPDTRDMWTDTDKEGDDVLMLSDRSDSGITSPFSQHRMDILSPCDLSSMEHINNDDVRKRIMAMSKRTCYEEEDKIALLQVLSLLNNLEAISQDHEITGDDLCTSFRINKFKQSSDLPTSTSRLPLNNFSSPSKSQERIVATVQPYSSGISEEEKNRSSLSTYSPKKSRYSSTLSLQESGVFESLDNCSQYTQTDNEDFPSVEKASGDLCAEIQKLNKFRKKIEECVTKSNKTGTVVNILSPNSSDQRRLQYYKERLELLENKILVYESTGDLQVRRLAERLQREIQLEAWVKQLTQRVEKLVEENLQLEEEKCEFEEAENDTRLHLQRLEVDLEILTQRNIELEMSRDSAKAHAVGLQDTINMAQERIYNLEEQKNDLKHKMEMLTMFMPTILLFNSWKMQQSNKCSTNNLKEVSIYESISSCLPGQVMPLDISSPEQSRLQELMCRERELTQNIVELNRAYNETLESADNLWAQMEKEYKEKLIDAEDENCLLKCKMNNLEEQLRCDLHCAHERIMQLEESENSLKHRICKLNREHKDETAKYSILSSELDVLHEDYTKLKKYLEGPATDMLERERKKVRDCEEELSLAVKIQNELEEVHTNQMTVIKNQLAKANKELIHIGVSNGELKEEVVTLENRIMELEKQHDSNIETIQNLTAELNSEQEELLKLTPIVVGAPNLADELGLANKNLKFNGVTDLSSATHNLTEALKNYEDCNNCVTTNDELKDVAIEVKHLANVMSSLQHHTDPDIPVRFNKIVHFV